LVGAVLVQHILDEVSHIVCCVAFFRSPGTGNSPVGVYPHSPNGFLLLWYLQHLATQSYKNNLSSAPLVAAVVVLLCLSFQQIVQVIRGFMQ